MDEKIYARDLDGTGSMHICSMEDPNAVTFIPETPMSSAAPELYEALEAELLGHLTDAQNWAEAGDHQAAEFHQKRANKLEALLAKARGES